MEPLPKSSQFRGSVIPPILAALSMLGGRAVRGLDTLCDPTISRFRLIDGTVCVSNVGCGGAIPFPEIGRKQA